MKKIFILLLIILTVSVTAVSAADRIAPTAGIGLFIDPDIFYKALQQTSVYDYVYEQNTFDHTAKSKVIVSVKEYRIEGDAAILCFFNKYNKIHGIRISMAPWYLVRDDCFEMYELVGMVLRSTGLLVSSDEYYDAISAIQNNEPEFLGSNYFMKRYVNNDDLTVDISSIYDVFQNLTPENLMGVYDDPCDPNYVGACIPITNKDLDCADIIFRNFFVTGKDKHRFDGDGNGVCCEPYPTQQKVK